MRDKPDADASIRARRASNACSTSSMSLDHRGGGEYMADSDPARRAAIKVLAGSILLASAGKEAASAAGEEQIIRALDGSMKASIGFLDILKGKGGIPKPAKRQQIRPTLSPTFANGLAEAIAKAAVEDQKLFPGGGMGELVALETAYAAKCVSFFPGAADLLRTGGWTSDSGKPIDWGYLFTSEILTNLVRFHSASID